MFRGQGRFTFAPPVPVEQAELQRFAGSPTLDDAFSEAILIFSDSTADQLRGLAFRPAGAPADVADHVHDLHSLDGDKEGSLGSDVIGPLLNRETTGFFLARLERANGGAVLFEIDPGGNEAVQLYRSVRKTLWGANWAVVTQFPPQHPLPGTAKSWALRERLTVPSYRIDVRVTPTFTADLDFAASATLALKADEPIGPWLLFALHPKVVVDSARWGTGEAANVFKAKDGGDVWVRAPHRLATGDSLTLTLSYHGAHGELIARLGDGFFIDPGPPGIPRTDRARTSRPSTSPFTPRAGIHSPASASAPTPPSKRRCSQRGGSPGCRRSSRPSTLACSRATTLNYLARRRSMCSSPRARIGHSRGSSSR